MIEAVLRAVGIFYVFAGVVAMRAGYVSGLMDGWIAAISMKPVPRGTRLRQRWLMAGSLVVGLGGAALVVLAEWAAWLFVAAALQQALYLLYVAPVHCDPDDPPDEAGRRSTRNAFLVHLVATAVVLAAFAEGRLRPAAAVPAVEWAVLVAAAAVLALSLAWPSLRARFGAGAAAAAEPDPDDGFDDAPEAEAPWPPTAIGVRAEHGCHPLWRLDGAGDIDPADLGLSDALAADLAAWAERFEGSLDMDDPGGPPRWTPAEYEAHERAGRDLALRLVDELEAAGRGDTLVQAFDAEHGYRTVSRPEA